MGATLAHEVGLASGEVSLLNKCRQVDILLKCPNPAKFNLREFSPTLALLKLFVFVYDLITLPLYALFVKPWRKRAENGRIRAKLENPDDPYSAYVSTKPEVTNPKVAEHYVFTAKTLAELQDFVAIGSPKWADSLGYRGIVDVFHEMEYGKRMTKLKLEPTYTWLSNGQVVQRIDQLARAFVSSGVQYQEKVLIFAETRMEWFLCAQALFRIGAIVTTLYTTLGTEALIYGINQISCLRIITTEDQLPKLYSVIDSIPSVRNIYVIEQKGLQRNGKATQQDFDSATAASVQLNTYEQMLELGEILPEEWLPYTPPKPEDIAVILYTSGTTGKPKGVIQTHHNLISQLRALYTFLGEPLLDPRQRHCFYACLPLAHTFELVCELFFWSAGKRIGYGSPYTMTDNSTCIPRGDPGDLKILSPTVLVGVPLILNRMRKSLGFSLENQTVFWRQAFKYACAYKNFWTDLGYDTPLVNAFVCGKVQELLGGKVQFMFVGGAPLSPETQRIMRAFLNVKLLIGYGSTETCGAVTTTDLEDNSIGTVGSLLSGMRVRLIDWPEAGYTVHDKPRPRGELVVASECISLGYFDLPEQTQEAFEQDKNGVRWFKTGDIGELLPNGMFKIIDRKRYLVKLQSGEYVSLGKVEAELKNFKYAENVCLHADPNQQYTIAFIAPAIIQLRKLARALSKPDTLTIDQLCSDLEIVEKLITELQSFAREAKLEKFEIPAKIKLCPEKWSVQTGFLTPSMKVDRKAIQKYYQEDIDAMYAST